MKITRSGNGGKDAGFALKISAVHEPIEGSNPLANDINMPIFITTKRTNKLNREKGHQLDLGYLYSSSREDTSVYYSEGKMDNLKKVFDWKPELSIDPSKLRPDDYNALITSTGDVIWITTAQSNTRANPIIYPAGDYSNPKVVNIPGIKPISATRNQGMDYCEEKDYFIFVEYHHQSNQPMHVWKVTAPFDNPENWRIVMTQTRNVDLLHYHQAQYDPFSGAWIVSSGDMGNHTKLWLSYDDGETWVLKKTGNQKWRTLNHVITEDYIYWVPDSGGLTGDYEEAHSLYRCGRDTEGYPNFDSTETLAVLPKWQASYGNVHLLDPNGILVLSNIDLDYTQLKDSVIVTFWSFDDEKLYEVGEYKRVYPENNDYSVVGKGAYIGFRSRGLSFYPSIINPNKAIVGFYDENKNYNDIGINKQIEQNNVVLEVVRK